MRFSEAIARLAFGAHSDGGPAPCIVSKSAAKICLQKITGRLRIVVKESPPLVAIEVEVNVSEWTRATHGQTESQRQSRRRPTINKKPGSIIECAGSIGIQVILGRQFAHLNHAEFAPVATPVNVIRNDPGFSRPV